MYEAPVAFVFAGLGSAVTGSDVNPGGDVETTIPEVELD